MPRSVKSEKLRRVQFPITVPRYLVETLSEVPNRSKIITQILEENAERIMSGNINKAIDYQRTVIRNEVLEVLEEGRQEFVDATVRELKRRVEYKEELKEISRSISHSLDSLIEKRVSELVR